MIRLNGVRYSIGTRVLLDDVTWVIGPGDRVALVGPNGAGKTTLLKIMLGEITPEAGHRVLSRGTRIGYLPQEAAERFDGTVLDRALEAHRHVLVARDELDDIYRTLESTPPGEPRLEALLDRAGELQHHLERSDEHLLEPEARRVLAGLGFTVAEQDRPLASFSGGWRMRAALAALLLMDPTVLFLDEPTNHLDLPAMEWLEDYLDRFRGGLVVVSHDRVFLDRVATEVRELDRAELTDYPMTFTDYLEEREARRERIEAQNEQLDAKIAQLSRFVERFGAKNTKATQAQSKRKQIERLKARRVVLPRRARGIRFKFPAPPHVGRTLVRLEEIAFGYDERDVLREADVRVERGDKVAIVGANGAGKTTLLRLLAGQLHPRAGRSEVHPQAELAFFAQHAAETLDGTLTVLEAVDEVASDAARPGLRSLLGTFLFLGDDAFKRCRVLSGGERQRVALARMLLRPANLLLLDEPTHHLDLAGKEVLEEALSQYPGAVVVVTHDRSLMARLATRVLAVDGGRVTSYPGGYEDYEAARTKALEEGRSGGLPEPRAADGGASAERSRGRKARPARRPPSAAGATNRLADHVARRTRVEREREAARVERAIEAQDKRIQELEAALADPDVYADGARVKELLSSYERLRAEVGSLWERLADLTDLESEGDGERTRRR